MIEILSEQQVKDLLDNVKTRFISNVHRHQSINWDEIEQKLLSDHIKLTALYAMEQTGGEPDVVGFDVQTNEYIFIDCCAETPSGRRSYCYDKEALDKRKQNKPANNVIDVANEMGIKLMNETEYIHYQALFGPFDQKSSSWIETPEPVRKLGGALFGDYRYGRIFIYHNGADSYYSSRGFRAILRV